MKKALTIIGAVCMAALLGLTITLFIFQYQSNKKLSQYIDDDRKYNLQQLNQDGYIEDGYIVADQYEIKSTAAISEAYLNDDDSNLTDIEKDTLALAKDVLDESGALNADTKYDAEVAIYEWMCRNLPHSDTGVGNVSGITPAEAVSTPYGVLTGKESVCVGYATTFRLLVNMLGMDCHIVHNESHSWDLVEMEDGSWYHVDVYSDIMGKGQAPAYGNFNMTDEVARYGHDWNDMGYLPAANQYTYCYAKMNSQTVDSITDIPVLLQARLAEKNGSFNLFFSFKDISEEDRSRLEILGSLLYEIINNDMEADYYETYADYNWIEIAEENESIFCIKVYDYSENGDINPDDIENYEDLYNEMVDSLNDAFGSSLSHYDESNWDEGWDEGWDEDMDADWNDGAA